MAVPHGADRKKVEADLVTCDRAFDISWYFALAFLLLGIIGEVTSIPLGLAPNSWFLLLVAALLASIVFRLGWAMAWYLKVSK